jgi:hypothetical protein
VIPRFSIASAAGFSSVRHLGPGRLGSRRAAKPPFKRRQAAFLQKEEKFEVVTGRLKLQDERQQRFFEVALCTAIRFGMVSAKKLNITGESRLGSASLEVKPVFSA